jgi:hypothetical protein
MVSCHRSPLAGLGGFSTSKCTPLMEADDLIDGLWFGLLRFGGPGLGTSRQPVWSEVVTHVAGTICNLWVRAGP